MLEEEEKTTVTYHDDGSNSQGVGGYSVQGINVNNYLPPAHTSHLIRDKAEPGWHETYHPAVALHNFWCLCGGTLEPDRLCRTVQLMIWIVPQKLDIEHIRGDLLCQVHQLYQTRFLPIFLSHFLTSRTLSKSSGLTASYVASFKTLIIRHGTRLMSLISISCESWQLLGWSLEPIWWSLTPPWLLPPLSRCWNIFCCK